MNIYSDSELFLGGMVTGAVLCLAIVLAFVLRPMRPRRRRGGGDAGSVRRAIDEAYDAGRARGREEGLGRITPRPMMRVVSRGDGGWVGRVEGGLNQDPVKMEGGVI
jgi:hypothetical protein